jgi:hypothetical protein
VQFTSPSESRIAIVETPLERGSNVYAINPKQLDRFRDATCACQM